MTRLKKFSIKNSSNFKLELHHHGSWFLKTSDCNNNYQRLLIKNQLSLILTFIINLNHFITKTLSITSSRNHHQSLTQKQQSLTQFKKISHLTFKVSFIFILLYKNYKRCFLPMLLEETAEVWTMPTSHPKQKWFCFQRETAVVIYGCCRPLQSSRVMSDNTAS